jgi:hypothetical protein
MATLRLLFGLLLGGLLISATAMAVPMHGTFTIGDDPEDDYASITAAVAALTANGVDGPVTFDVEELTYSGAVTMAAITGASGTNTITFRDAGTLDTPPLISATASPALNLNGADYITFDGIDITLTTTGKVVQITNNADYNVIKNCTLTGTSETSSSNYGIYIYNGGNDSNLVENVTVEHTIYYPAYLRATSSTRDAGNEVRNCTFIGGRYSVYLNYQNGASVHDCDIQPGYDGSSTVYGIYCTSQAAGDLAVAYGNKIHNIRGNSTTYVIYAGSSSGGFNAYNNFVYDFEVTGSSAAYALYAASGSPEFYFNSVYIGDVGTTGNADGFYEAGSSTAATLKNNIFQIEEPTTACWAIYRSAGTLTSDYNCVYSSGPGALYNMGRDGSTDYATLALWQAGTARDSNSVEGNPSFLSATNLHIDPHATARLVDSAATPITGITSDIDGDTRDAAFPDIGADEYTFEAIAHDYAVNCFIGMTGLYTANTPVVISAEVLNNGANAETDVPVVLFYNGTPQDTILLSLAPSAMDTVDFDWLTPVVEYEVGELKAKAFCPSDGNASNDSTTAPVIIYNSSPMHGVYDVGGGLMHIATVAGAGHALTLRGVDGAVTFNVYPLTYNGSVTVGSITGASATNTTIFREAPAHLDTPPEIVAATTPALNLDGSDYVTFDGIDVTLTVTGKVVQITGDADYNVIKNCLLTGASESGTSNYGVFVTGGGNDYNVIENVTVNRTVYYSVSLEGVSGISDQGNEVRYCTLIGGLEGVILTRQNGAVVHHCDIQPGYDGLSATVMGIEAYTQTAGDVCTAYANKIHNLRSASHCYAINADAGTGGLFKAYNNFVYDFVVTGTGSLAGLRIESGTAEYYFNSVRIGDVGTTGGSPGINGFYQAGSSSAATVENNVFEIEEPTAACWAINHSNGTLTTSDYNAVYGTGTGYSMGRDLGTSYANLALWQGGLSRDLNSVEGNPGFVSSTDLHIQPHYSLLNGTGLDITGITTDIDSDGRGSPPDIGADEYTHTAMADDYGVNNWVGFVSTYVSAVPVVIRAEVKNYGTNAETDVPVVLYYNNVSQDTVLLSLTSGAKDTVELDWTPPVPAGDQEFGTVVVKAFCPSDTFAPNDSVKAAVSVVRPPLHGVYALGGLTYDYASFGAAITSLSLRGVDGPVTFNVYDTTYSESMVIPPITGASATNTIIFRDAGNSQTPLLISASTSPAVNLNGADYITFDGINIRVTVNTGKVVQITGNADYNVIKNCTLAAPNNTSTNYGVYITGGGDDYNVVENVTVNSLAYYPVYLSGASGASDQGNEVRYCTLIGGQQCVTLTYQNGAVVRNCDIQPGRNSGTTTFIGIYCTTLAAGEMCTAYANKIHNIRSGGTANCVGLYAYAGTGGSFKAYNNFVYDFLVTGSGTVYGLLVYSGTAEFYFNSVYIGHVGTSGNVYAFNQAATSTVVLENNIFQIDEPVLACWAIYHGAGTLASDYNCVYGPGPGAPYNMGRDGATDYPALAAWQAGTGRDLNSVEGNPGFIGLLNLHIDSLATLVDAAGTPIDGITDDIDGDVRDAAFPDIGADEYTVFSPVEAVDSLTIFPDVVADSIHAILRWPAAAGANSYKVYRGTTYGFVIDGTTYIGQTATTTYTDVGVLATTGNKYYVVIASTEIIARER